ncbi:xanthine phosphoribosyltransferase [Aerococcaceae bacterium DSM 109653]|uniref:Xanthine phosphoribosyltransferase n=1 Tax=Fundicoccus ignavus TaxID=2664442 RepID=A0A844BP30_9LACT|nr:xanthine phosphoribosyltransferase [Fundicoccus ignavus]MRI81938.1 xanthine phosphoribosyltransferase [Fundicoccus ignavus]
MSYLREMILKHGQVFPNNVLKVNSFLNHQIDPIVIEEIEKEFYKYFGDRSITKVLTIESSGIAPALLVAHHLGVPMLFAKKAEPSTLAKEDKYVTSVHSYTKNVTSNVLISKEYLSANDKVLIIDDFLANGQAALGLVDLVEQAGGETVGVGICIEKSFQPGRQYLEAKGVDVFSICRIQSLENGKVTFLNE